jgi:hypothetical protein
MRFAPRDYHIAHWRIPMDVLTDSDLDELLLLIQFEYPRVQRLVIFDHMQADEWGVPKRMIFSAATGLVPWFENRWRR